MGDLPYQYRMSTCGSTPGCRGSPVNNACSECNAKPWRCDWHYINEPSDNGAHVLFLPGCSDSELSNEIRTFRGERTGGTLTHTFLETVKGKYDCKEKKLNHKPKKNRLGQLWSAAKSWLSPQTPPKLGDEISLLAFLGHLEKKLKKDNQSVTLSCSHQIDLGATSLRDMVDGNLDNNNELP